MNKDKEKSTQKLLLELEKRDRQIAQLKHEATRFSTTRKLQNALFRIVDLTHSTEEIGTYFKELHFIITELTTAKNLFIALYHKEENCISFPYYKDDEDDQQNINDPIFSGDKKIPFTQFEGTPTFNVIQSGNPQHLSRTEFLKFTSRGKPPEDWLGVPLILDDKVLGAIVIQSYQKDFRYNKRDASLLGYVSQHIAAGLRKKQDAEALMIAHKQLKEANLELENRVSIRTKELHDTNIMLEAEIEVRKNSENIQIALFKITELVSTTTNLDELFEEVHKIVGELMYAENAYIAIFNEETSHIEFPYFFDQFEERPEDIPVDLSSNDLSPSLTVEVLLSGETLLVNQKEDFEQRSTGPISVSWLGTPLQDNDKTFGVIAIQSYEKKHVHSLENLSVLKIIAKQVSTAILRKQDAVSLHKAHENLERRVKERTSILEKTIINRRNIEQKLKHDSLHDSLTQLPNRKFLTEKLATILATQPTDNASDIALLFLDLDRFKIINDSLGHQVGDLFLIEVSKRLKGCMRGDDIVVRLGGDEFCILMYNVTSESIAINLAERVLNQLKVPVDVEKHSLFTSASIGVRLAKIGTDNSIQVLGDADSAMYQAKHNGKNRYCLFDAAIKKIISKRLQLEHDLRHAIGTSQIRLYYQPILDLFDQSIVGLEALLRWKHPTLGYISPVEFITIAEETGIIKELGDSVIIMACQGLKEFATHAKTAELYVNINISAVQILSRTLDEFIRQQIMEYNLNPALLNAEITESLLVDDFRAATLFVQELKSIGMKVLLDDFGTGYSSLSYLHQFPFDLIKLDRFFIQSSSDSENNITLIESIGFLASNLGMDIVVEGIETEEQLQLAINLNCRYAQGYLFSRPLPKSEIIQFVKNYEPSL